MHACADGREIEVDGVIGITWRILILDSKASNCEGTLLFQNLRDRNMARRERRMHGVLIEEAETHVDGRIGTFGWHDNGELLYQATRIRRRNFTQGAFFVERKFFMTVDGQWQRMISFFKNCFRAFYIVKVRIDNCGNWCRRKFA